ncbi:MAG: NRDE family protein [Desulfobulbaceae bacterium]|jgi:uncharacterized protein with NRDE domain|nr:NRDE family protein [Desulfobulbaceae bacterium]
MCLIWFSYENIFGFRLLLAANRDEFFARPTAPLTWHDDILAGWDEEGGGTWLGINRLGQLAALTNHRDPSRQRPNPPSRGAIIVDFLRSGQPAAAFLRQFRPQAAGYNPFNFLLFDGKEMLFFNNAGGGAERVMPGTHALSNRFLDTEWPKTRRVKELLAPLTLAPKAFAPGQIKTEEFFAALADRHQPEDGELPETGVGIEWERILAPIFIASANYGTRSSALVTIGDSGRIDFYERSYQHSGDAVSISGDRHVHL